MPSDQAPPPGQPDDAPKAAPKATPAAPDREALQASMREFAESAGAVAAASLRLQMMMLEQAREMMDDVSGLFAQDTGKRRDDA
ncbi:MAG: hypothetical protein RQ752_05635 [Thermohalobaculum sp.]|nr:hypothetical protein [Thermohalobaculum sp.]